MPGRCCVPGCPNRRRWDTVPGMTIHYYRFPKIKDVRQKWIKACRRKEFNPDNSRICNIHFLEEDYERNLKAELLGFDPRVRYLKKNAVPSLNLPQKIGPPILKFKNRCAVQTCPNHYAEFEKNLTFFKFPQDFDMRKKWISTCKLDTTLITDTSEICSEHFMDSDYVQDLRVEQSKLVPARVKALRNYLKKELRKDAVPSLKLPEDAEPKNRILPVKSSQLKSNVEHAPQVKEVDCSTSAECVLGDPANSSADISTSCELDFETFPSSEMQNQLKEVGDWNLRENNKNANLEYQLQECPNCSEMKRKILQLEEENKRLKDKLGEKNTVKLRAEMQKILTSALGCHLNQDQNNNISKKNNGSSLQLSPIGVYRLYSVTKEPNSVGLKQLVVLGTDRTTN